MGKESSVKKLPMYGLAQGPQGESILSGPLWGMMAERVNELPELFQKTAGLNDHRLLALVTAMIVEDRINKVLSAFFARPKLIVDNDKFTFSMRIRVLEAANIIPLHITEACDIIRDIRNTFAHQLDITSFDQIDKPWKRVSGLISRRPDIVGSRGESRLDQFRSLSFVAIVGLDSFKTSARLLREALQNPAVINKIAKEHATKCDLEFSAALAKGPHSAIQQSDGKWHWQYDFFFEAKEHPPTGVPCYSLPKKGD